MNNQKYIDTRDIPEIEDFSDWRPNPYLDRLENGYTIRVHVPPRSERLSNRSDLVLTDDELKRMKELVANEERKRGIIV